MRAINQHSAGVLPAIGHAKKSGRVLVGQLQEALRATKADLHNSIARLEASNRALQISNDQVVAINEELQRSQEALQSLNDELTTVNQALQSKICELESSHADLRNLLASSAIATICLQHDFRIKWFSPEASAVFNIAEADIGRDIRTFSTIHLGAGLLTDAKAVLKTLVPKERELIFLNHACYLRRILPYRNGGDRVAGVVITYTDITEARKAAETTAAVQKTLASSLEVRVRERTMQLRMLTAELALTEERERRLLAQDLHDGLGQILAILKIKLTSIKESERRGTLKKAFREIEDLIDQSNKSVRTLMLQLSPPVLQALGLLPALEWLAEEMERVYGLHVRIHSDGQLILLKEPAKTTLFRAVRELLINVSKHAACNMAEVDCSRSTDGLKIVVSDQGEGFSHDEAILPQAGKSGFGLISIKDRIEFIGGDMWIDSAPGRGTNVTITFPALSADKNLGEAA
jgi:signal transduction histidine kinase